MLASCKSVPEEASIGQKATMYMHSTAQTPFPVPEIPSYGRSDRCRGFNKRGELAINAFYRRTVPKLPHKIDQLHSTLIIYLIQFYSDDDRAQIMHCAPSR